MQPGYKNPIVTAHVFSLDAYDNSNKTSSFRPSHAAEKATQTLSWDGRLAPEDSIIFEVVWINNETLIVKEVNRAADKGNIVFFDTGAPSFHGDGRVVRALGAKGEEGDKGWIDSVRA